MIVTIEWTEVRDTLGLAACVGWGVYLASKACAWLIRLNDERDTNERRLELLDKTVSEISATKASINNVQDVRRRVGELNEKMIKAQGRIIDAQDSIASLGRSQAKLWEATRRDQKRIKALEVHCRETSKEL